MYYETFERLCNTRGLKPIDVSRGTGISTATLTSWKKGKYTPKSDKLKLIADFFNVSLEFMTTGVESTKPDAHVGWYLDEETAKAAQEVFDDPDTRMLFDAARNASPEAIKLAADLLKTFKKTNPDG